MNRGIEIDNSIQIKQSLRNEAHRRYEELVTKKIEEIKSSYVETPEFKRAVELAKEAEEIVEKLKNITSEYRKITAGTLHDGYYHKSEDAIIWDLSKGLLLNLSIGSIIDDYITIKMATPEFNAEHCLVELIKIIEEELSHIK